MTTPRIRNRSREFDVVLFGATGYTGSLIAEYFAKNYGDSDIRFALAGRDRAKLEKVRSQLATTNAKAQTWPLVIVDAADANALNALCARTEVVATTVGPYGKYGAPLVAACVANGTDYCDLTGETVFIRDMIDAHHEEAKRTGARIVHCCGFDSIPSDIGVLFLQDEAQKRFGVQLSEIRFYTGKMRGGVSGGTIASMLHLMEEREKRPGIDAILKDAYALTPGERGDDRRDQMGAGYVDELKQWSGPFVMAAINTRVVRRTNALLAYRYGKHFRYSEAMGTGAGAAGHARAIGMSLGLGAFFAVAAMPPARRFLAKQFLPKPGEGPTKEARDNGFFNVHLLGRGTTASGEVFKLNALIAGDSDPGYGETAKMLGESALCLALDGATLNVEGGIRTPASTMGTALLARLQKAGMRFTIE